MSGYPSQNPNSYYPPPPNLPYPPDPMNQFGFQNNPPPMGFNQAAYPPMGPNPAYPSAPVASAPPVYPSMSHPGTYSTPQNTNPYPSNNTAYPPNTTPYPSNSAPYPTHASPYPSNTSPYPSNTTPYPSNASPFPANNAPYPTNAFPQAASTYPTGGSQYPIAQPRSTTAHYPSQQSSHPKMVSTTSTITTTKKPTIVPHQPFDPRKDAEALRKAMKGFGTDEQAIINVLAYRTNQQRQEITVQYKALFGKDLIKDLKSELSGKFEDVIVAVMTPLPEYLARELHQAIDGFGTNENTLVEVLCTMNNAWIQAICAQYQRLYSKSLESDIKGDTSGYFQRLLVSLCQGRRDENQTVDIGGATADAHALYKAGAGRIGTDEATFNMILVSRSIPQLNQVFIEYEKVSGKSIESTIKAEFSGSIETGLLAIVKSVRHCAEFFADRLYSSMAGAGTNDKALIRIIVTRAEFDLGNIKVAFQTKYKKSLASFIDGDCSGDYKKMLLAMIS